MRFKQVVVHESVGPIVDFALIVNRQRHKFRVFESLRIIHESREIDPNGLLWLPNTRHVLFENCSLDASEYQVAVGFDQHDLARVGLVHQELGHLDLQRRMQMSLGVLDRHDLVLPQQPRLNHDGSQLVKAGTHDMPRGGRRGSSSKDAAAEVSKAIGTPMRSILNADRKWAGSWPVEFAINHSAIEWLNTVKK